MSDRQARNWSKAKRRRERLLSTQPVVDGFSAKIKLADYDHVLCVALERDADGQRMAVSTKADRLWRHMDKHIPWNILVLLDWFVKHPPVTP